MEPDAPEAETQTRCIIKFVLVQRCVNKAGKTKVQKNEKRVFLHGITLCLCTILLDFHYGSFLFMVHVKQWHELCDYSDH